MGAETEAVHLVKKKSDHAEEESAMLSREDACAAPGADDTDRTPIISTAGKSIAGVLLLALPAFYFIRTYFQDQADQDLVPAVTEHGVAQADGPAIQLAMTVASLAMAFPAMSKFFRMRGGSGDFQESPYTNDIDDLGDTPKPITFQLPLEKTEQSSRFFSILRLQPGASFSAERPDSEAVIESGAALRMAIPERAYPYTPSYRETDDIDQIELAQQLRLIDALEIADPGWLFGDSDRDMPHARGKRQVGLQSLELYKNASSEPVRNMLLDEKKYPSLMMAEVVKVYEKIEKTFNWAKKKYIPNSRESARRIIKSNYLATALEVVIATLDESVAQGRSDTLSYGYLYLCLRDLWKMVENEMDRSEQADIRNWVSAGRSRIDAQTRLREKNSDADDDIRLYIGLHYGDWSARDIASQTVVIHSGHNVSFFHLRQILESQHAHYMTGADVFYHFRFDNDGLPDAQLKALLKADEPQRWREYQYNRDQYRLAVANESRARSLLENRFKDLYLAKRIGVDRAALLEELMEGQDAGMQLAFLGLMSEEPLWSVQEKLLLAFVESRLIELISAGSAFEAEEIQEMMKHDYVMSYEDDTGGLHYDTTTLQEYVYSRVNRHDGIHIDVAHRKNVQILIPSELSRLIATDDALGGQIRMLAKMTGAELQGTELAAKLLLHMPPLTQMLETIIIETCSGLGLASCNLSDDFSFEYKRSNLQIRNNRHKSASRPMLVHFTALEILTGRQRHWESRHKDYIHRERIGHVSSWPEEKIDEYVQRLQEIDVQARLIDRYQNFKSDVQVKHAFADFMKWVVAQVPANWTHEFEFPQTPLFRLYGRYSRGGWGPLHDLLPLPRIKSQIVLSSRLSGKIYTFENGAAMLDDLSKNHALATEFKRHFPAGFDENLAGVSLDVKERNESFDAYFDRYIEWKKKNIDRQITSAGEAHAHVLLDWLVDIGALLQLATVGLGPIPNALFGLLLTGAPVAAQAWISDDLEEQWSLLRNFLLILMMESMGAATGPVSNARIHPSRFVSGNPKNRLTIAKSALDSSPYLRKRLAREFDIDCPVRPRRGIGELWKCIFKTTKKESYRFQSKSGRKPIQTQDFSMTEPVRNRYAIRSSQTSNEMEEVLRVAKEHRELKELINTPTEKCELAMKPVGEFAKKQGFTEIQYRGMNLWKHANDEFPNNHYVVLGKKNGNTYVLDLTAGQFQARGFASMGEDLILLEEAWCFKYQQAFQNQIIKYQDFASPEAAKIVFNPIISMGQLPGTLMPGARLLNVPRRYAQFSKGVALN